jgi:4-hydroxy-3-polyprenylbenzoate decarboxylase
MSTYIVAITGASGAIYAKGFLQEILALGHCVELVLSPTGEQILDLELGFSPQGTLAEKQSRWAEFLGQGEKSLHLLDHRDLAAGISSGSFPTSGMIVIPCSMGTLGRIATGVSTNLIERAADVTLKERRPLILVTRETPLSLIHLRNMAAVTEAGAVVMPPVPSFYHHPATIDDLVTAFVGRVLDRLGIPNHLTPRWTESPQQIQTEHLKE